MPQKQPVHARTLIALSGAALLACPGARTTSAAPSPATLANEISRIEVVVLEAPGCVYCDMFRVDVKPAYEASETGHEAPLRFLDLNDEAAEKLDLTGGPVDIVPTFVVMKDRKEVARIPGYLGRENFFRTLNALLPTLK